MALFKKFYTKENVFDPKYYGEKVENTFNTEFHQINNRGSDIELDEIIIFDGGDVYGYEKTYQNDLLVTSRAE